MADSFSSNERWINVKTVGKEIALNMAMVTHMGPSPYLDQSGTIVYFGDNSRFLLVQESIDYLLAAPDIRPFMKEKLDEA